MRIQFVNAVLSGDFSAMDIAITSLASYINERTQHNAGIIDLVFHQHKWESYLKQQLEESQPHWVGISTNTLYMQYYERVMHVVASMGIPIVVGGHHASTRPEETFADPKVTALVRGDGEYALEKLLDKAEQQESCEGIPGLWIKEGYRRHVSESGYFIEPLEALPYLDWSLWKDLDKYFYFLGMLYLIFSRGCPYRCEFCDAWGLQKSVEGHYFRLKPAKASAQELWWYWNKYRHRGVRLAQLFDPVFTLNREWLRDFCGEYESLGSPLPFSAFSRIDNLDEETIHRLAQANCKLLRVGIESGDEYIRNEVYKKKISDRQIRDVFQLCKKEGIGFTAFYILGGPGETRKTINTTIKMAVELNANRTAFFIYKPFTQEAEDLVTAYGGYIDPTRWEKADNITFDAVISSPDLSPRMVELMQVKAYFLTFGRRLLRIIRKYKVRYFVWLVQYMTRGLRAGLNWKYLLLYFHIYHGPLVKE